VPVATLQFQLPDDEEDFRLAVNAPKLAVAIDRADQACRNVMKYHENPSPDAVQLAEEVRQILAEYAAELLC
jgi:predicted metal-binding protein